MSFNAISKRAFSTSTALRAPYRTSTGQEAVLPVYAPKRPGGSKCAFPDYLYVDNRERQTLTYPFSKTVRVPFLPPLPSPSSPLRAAPGTSVLSHINESLKMTLDPNSFHHLFARSNAERFRSGSIITVTSYTTGAKTHSTTFTGVLMGVRRRGINTSFTLRNVVLRTGVEMKYLTSSPLIKDVQLVKQADGTPGQIAKHKQAKLFYYRDQPERLAVAANALKNGRRSGGALAGTTFA